MQTKHTPGPWTKSNNVRQRDDAQRIYAGDIPVASVHHLSQKTTEAFYQAHANARLIAAAPDLLAALQSALSDAKPTARREYWRDGADGESSELVLEETWPDWIDAARAAINRATGA